MTPPGGSPTAATRLFGVLGHPVAHSLSPRLQNAAFRALGIDACYLAFDVSADSLPVALGGLRALGAGGLNVTVPLKELALQLSAEATPAAKLAGAANTLVPCDGGWKAHNTDIAGFLRAVEEELGYRPTGRRALILGAGGAARAAAVGLLESGIQEILVANRNRQRAEKLVFDLARAAGGNRITAVDIAGQARFELEPGDLVVSATPAGLDAGARWPWDLGAFARGVAFYDMAYGAGETPLAAAAKNAGFAACSGRRMLLHQGAAAFELWTGRPAPLEAMEKALGSARPGPAA